MNTRNSIEINLKHYLAPRDWNDLDDEQLLKCYEIVMKDELDIFSPMEIVPLKKLQLLKVLCDLDDEAMKRWSDDCLDYYGEEHGRLIFLAEVEAVLSCSDGLFQCTEEENEDGTTRTMWQVALTRTKCPFPKIKSKDRLKKSKFAVGKRRGKLELHAPKDGLSNLTIYELASVFSLFEEFIKLSTDPQSLPIEKRFPPELTLHKLLATIYRPKKAPTQVNLDSNYQGDVRQPYLHYEAAVEKRIPYMKRLPPIAKRVLFFWIASCRQQIVQENPDLFGEGSSNGVDMGWSGLLLSLADSAKASDLEDVARSPYGNVFAYLRMLEIRRKEQEKELAKQRINA